jgi:hypothetical protein
MMLEKSGCEKGFGRFGVGLTQVMSYPEFGIANKNMGPNWNIQEVLQDSNKQIDIIIGLMIQKQQSLSEEYDENQMYNLAQQNYAYAFGVFKTLITILKMFTFSNKASNKGILAS